MNPSILITPNAKEAGKLYSIIPTDGSGDLSVVRATSATRVNSDGLIEQVPYNLVTYSEQFNNAAWSKINSTVVSNTTTAPNGTLTADSLTDNSTNGIHVISNSGGGTGVFTFSFYAKANTLNRIGLLTSVSVNTTLSSTAQVFDLLNGTVVNTISGVNASIETLANSWFRCSVTLNALTSGTYFITCIKTGTNIGYIGSGESVFIWGAQLVTGSSAKEYFPTTDRLNVPRFDYSNGSCPSILVEPQRTNLFIYSEQFNNLIKERTTVISDAIIAPNGTLTADKLVEDSSLNSHRIRQNISIIDGNTYTFTIYAKASERNKIRLFIGGENKSCDFDLINGTLLNNSGLYASITPAEYGFFRCSITITSTLTDSKLFLIAILDDNYNFSYQGDGTSGIYIWGAQLEEGSNATSYIPTVASTVTRNADVISKTDISDLIGQTEGTLYIDANINYTAFRNGIFLIIRNQANTSNRLQIYFNNNANNNIAFNHVVNGVNNIVNSNIVSSGNVKIAIAYKNGEPTTMYLNGVSYSTSGNIGSFTDTINSIYYGIFGDSTSAPYDGLLGNAMIFKTRLTNTDYEVLTGTSYTSYSEMATALGYTII